MNDLRAGAILAGRYQLIDRIRSGASATVWQAHDSVDNDSVALKFCPAAADGANRLQREYSDMRALDHPGIVRALRSHAGHDPPFLVLEHVDGPELRTAMGADPRNWIPVLRPALDGLAHAHARGVAHGDLSLHNIVVGPGGRGRLVDFGSSPDRTVADDLRDLGRLLYELTTGLPLAPGDSPARDAAVPRELWRLIEALQGKGDEVSLADATATLDRLLNDRPGQQDEFERITPVRRDSADSAVRPEGTRPGYVRVLQVAVVAIAIAGLVSIALLLPRMIGPREGAEASAARETENAAALRLAEQRQQVADLRTAVYAKWLQLENMDVRTWARLRADRAMERLSEGERMESAFETLAAIRELGAAERLLQGLLDEAPAIAQFHREAGWQAYRAGDGDQAASHFQIVLAIEPGAEEIRDALVRARFLDQTAALRRTASEQEAAGDVDGAIATLQEALRIDDGNPEIANDLGRLEDRLARQRFDRQMSAVYRELQDGRYAAARRALEQAANVRPGAAEVRDARVELQVRERDAAIRRLQAAATQAETEQDWEAAIGLYSELLSVDSALVFAQQGRDHTRLLASLTARTQSALETDLSREDVRRQAEALVAQIDSVQAQAPKLKALGADLAAALQRSREPVTVRLQSDSQTEITIFRIGRLGRFEQHELELLPGRYTVLGTCDGYRDVRRELVVQPGEPPLPMTIRCEERI